MKNFYKGYNEISYIPKTTGLLTIIHLPTGKFFLVVTTDLRGAAYFAHAEVGHRRYHNPVLNELTVDPEVQLGYDYTETESIEEARRLRHQVMTEHYGSPLILNQQDWPSLTGVYILTHTPTGKFYAGTSTDIIKQQSYQFTLLRTGKHKSAEMQKLWDNESNKDNMKWSWIIFRDIEDAKRHCMKIRESDKTLCLNTKKPKGGPTVGVYILRLKGLPQYYIGSSVTLSNRIRKHISSLKKGNHSNYRLQELYSKTENPEVEFDIQECATHKEALYMEQRLIDMARHDCNCLNVSANVYNPALGLKDNLRVIGIKKRKMKAWHVNNPEKTKKAIVAMQEARSMAACIDGVSYMSLRKAWEATGKNWHALYKRLDDPNDLAAYRIGSDKDPNK